MRTAAYLLFLFVFILPVYEASAQSPYYSLIFSVKEDTGQAENVSYKISHKLCESGNRIVQDVFSHDTSGINWPDAPAEFLNTFTCKEMADIITEDYEYSNHHLVYENIVHLTIISEPVQDTMQIVFPFRINSFVTFTDLGDIPFKKGIYEIDDGLEYSFINEIKMKVTLRDDYEWTPAERSRLIIER